MLDKLGEWVSSGSRALDAHSVAVCLHGLREQGDTPATRRVLGALLPRVRRCNEPLAALGVGLALNGLRGFGGTPEVRRMLLALLPLVAGCGEPLAPHHVAMGIFGLHGLGACAEAEGLVRQMGKAAERLPRRLAGGNAAGALHGLLALAEAGAHVGDSVRAVLERLPEEMPRGEVSRVSLLQALHVAGVTHMPRDPEAAPLRPEEESEHVEKPKHKSGPNAWERVVGWILRSAGVEHAQCVDHPSGFEMDFLIGGVNVELDGDSPHYRSPGKRSSWELRRRYLERQGIRVRRINTTGRRLADVVGEIAESCSGSLTGTAAALPWARARALAERGFNWALYQVGPAARSPPAAPRGAGGRPP
eukprot:TRINITY_DN24834_c0_g2_i2.p2 TRINITY_DN24834_c0_g2~~TRINITY_DN24834_c0_g2_i2.p2  ORF type:complete len:362 (+),score=77.00 TRINITY_DN24834_c0_g2_i2:1-1086(+)